MKAKIVTTFDAEKQENGWLMELQKQGYKTSAYLTASKPGSFKGYHLHRVRAAHYICIRGEVTIVLYKNPGNVCPAPRWVREEHILRQGDKLDIPIDTATGLLNTGTEEAWIINFPNPAYDPTLTDEQVEYTQKELEKGVVK